MALCNKLSLYKNTFFYVSSVQKKKKNTNNYYSIKSGKDGKPIDERTRVKYTQV